MIKKLKKKLLTREYFFINAWIILIFSININFNDLNLLNYSFINIINISRYTLAKLIFFILLFYYLIQFKNIKIDSLYFFLLLFPIILLFSYIYNGFFNTQSVSFPYNLYDLGSYDLSLSFISTIIFFILLHNADEKLSKKIFNIFFTIIFFYILLITIPLIYNFFINEKHIFYLYYQETFKAEQKTFGQLNQKVTGMARMVSVLFCFFLFYLSYLINSQKKIFYKFKLCITCAILFFLSFCAWGFQSRGGLISYLVIILVFFALENLNTKKKLFIFVTLCIIPFFTFELTLFYKIKNFSVAEESLKINDNNRFFNTFKEINNFTLSSSGRTAIWIRAIEKSKNKIIFGYGESGDRRALTVNKENISPLQRHLWDNNTANGLLYSLISGGIVASVIFLIIIFKLVIYSINLVIKKNIFKIASYQEKFSFTIILLLVIRSLYENSFSQFGIDLLLILCSYQILIKTYSAK